MQYHEPVLLEEAIDGLNIYPEGTYVDATFGGGGHSRAILKRLCNEGKLIAFDQDPEAIKNNVDDARITLIQANFRHIGRFLRFYGIEKIDGILIDLGVSSHQFDIAERGFSTRFDGPLDMRMNPQNKQSASSIINRYEEVELQRIFFEYGELRSASRIAKAIVRHRVAQPIETSCQLKDILKPYLPPRYRNKVLAQAYQAIRIEVNQEVEALKECMQQIPGLLKQGGRLSAISYHSLEDRLVKRFMRNGLFEGEPERDAYGCFEVPLKPLGKLVTPSEEEIKRNSRSRSAKLRIAEKT